MTERERALFRYLTMWADFSTREALEIIREKLPCVPIIHRIERCGEDSTGSIDCQMEQDKNRRAA